MINNGGGSQAAQHPAALSRWEQEEKLHTAVRERMHSADHPEERKRLTLVVVLRLAAEVGPLLCPHHVFLCS